MVKPITEYTKEELEEKITKIKAERERTAEALKKYEEELERRKQEVPLGVPSVGRFRLTYDGHVAKFLNNKQKPEDYNFNIFPSEESAEKHSKMLRDWRKDGLMANAKGEPIDIKVLLPLLKKGWVAMDVDKSWYWFPEKPRHDWNTNTWSAFSPCYSLDAFHVKPAKDWETSLMECGL